MACCDKYCPQTRVHPPREMQLERAVELYGRLRKYLRVVPASNSCWLPRKDWKGGFGDHDRWPLHHRRGYGTSPLAVTWGSSKRHAGYKHPTFSQFLAVYNITCT